MSGGNYLPLDCPSCGRARMWAWADKDGRIRVWCEKCDAESWTCDPAQHRAGGPHPQQTERSRQ